MRSGRVWIEARQRELAIAQREEELRQGQATSRCPGPGLAKQLALSPFLRDQSSVTFFAGANALPAIAGRAVADLMGPRPIAHIASQVDGNQSYRLQPMCWMLPSIWCLGWFLCPSFAASELHLLENFANCPRKRQWEEDPRSNQNKSHTL